MKNLLKLTVLSVVAFSLGALHAVPTIYYHNQSKWPVFVVYSSGNPPTHGSRKVQPGDYIDLSTLPGDHTDIILCMTADLSTRGVSFDYHKTVKQYPREKAVTLEMGSNRAFNDPRNLVVGAPIEEEWEMVGR